MRSSWASIRVAILRSNFCPLRPVVWSGGSFAPAAGEAVLAGIAFVFNSKMLKVTVETTLTVASPKAGDVPGVVVQMA